MTTLTYSNKNFRSSRRDPARSVLWQTRSFLSGLTLQAWHTVRNDTPSVLPPSQEIRPQTRSYYRRTLTFYNEKRQQTLENLVATFITDCCPHQHVTSRDDPWPEGAWFTRPGQAASQYHSARQFSKAKSSRFVNEIKEVVGNALSSCGEKG